MVAQCKPLTKDHLPLTTTFPGTKGWSLVTGFTVLQIYMYDDGSLLTFLLLDSATPHEDMLWLHNR